MTWDVCSDPAIGYDLSHWQGKSIPWSECVALGVRWAVSKSWHGSSSVATCEGHLQGAVEAGIEVFGRYAWMLPDSDLDRQCAAWLSVGRRMGELPLTIDFEEPSTSVKGRSLVLLLERAIETVSDKLGERPILYTGSWYWERFCQNEDSAVAASCPLWIAAYPRIASDGVRYQQALAEVCAKDPPKVPLPWRKRGIVPVAWQFDGDRGLRMPNGVDVDVNTAAWSRLRAMALGATLPPRAMDAQPTEQITLHEFLANLFRPNT